MTEDAEYGAAEDEWVEVDDREDAADDEAILCDDVVCTMPLQGQETPSLSE